MFASAHILALIAITASGVAAVPHCPIGDPVPQAGTPTVTVTIHHTTTVHHTATATVHTVTTVNPTFTPTTITVSVTTTISTIPWQAGGAPPPSSSPASSPRPNASPSSSPSHSADPAVTPTASRPISTNLPTVSPQGASSSTSLLSALPVSMPFQPGGNPGSTMISYTPTPVITTRYPKASSTTGVGGAPDTGTPAVTPDCDNSKNGHADENGDNNVNSSGDVDTSGNASSSADRNGDANKNGSGVEVGNGSLNGNGNLNGDGNTNGNDDKGATGSGNGSGNVNGSGNHNGGKIPTPNSDGSNNNGDHSMSLCCNHKGEADSVVITTLANVLNLDLSGKTGVIGVGCTLIGEGSIVDSKKCSGSLLYCGFLDPIGQLGSKCSI
ncbi:hypothetical protein BU17DRAFT_92434 [Hysterangium stoloniferum]|nr:hypothetical protein BU17DRAFT_92434 [Hysterangium stoloniferum]